MKLPALCVSTPVSFRRTTPPARQSRCLMVTSLALPTISTDRIPRLDPLHPPMVSRRTVSLETSLVHQHNHQRTLIMQRREHCRYHQVWRRPFYGTSSEREEYRKELCDNLIRQMEEKRLALALQLARKVKDGQYLCEADRVALSRDREERIKHRRALTLCRDENKKLMEHRWKDRALAHSLEAVKETERLRLNPINWSGTLK